MRYQSGDLQGHLLATVRTDVTIQWPYITTKVTSDSDAFNSHVEIVPGWTNQFPVALINTESEMDNQLVTK